MTPGFGMGAFGVAVNSRPRKQGPFEPTLRPASYVKAIPNEYNGGAGLGASGKQVCGHCHFPVMADMFDGSHELRFWHGAVTAGLAQPEWSTGGTMKTSASLLWIDNSNALQLTTYDPIKDTAQAFEETILRRSTIRPKVGSHALLTYFAEFSVSGYYSHARADYAQGEALRYAASGLPNYVGTNSIYADTYSGAGDFWGPSFWGWSGGDLSLPTAVISGDSNHSGVLTNARSDVPDTPDGAIGSVARILLPYMPCIDISVPGARASELADATKTVYRDKLGGRKRGKVLVPPLGTNDTIFNNDSEATLDANLNAYVARLGFDLAFLPTIPAVVTSQAANTVYNSGRDPVRRARNTSLRAKANVMDVALGTESVGTPGTLQVLADTMDGTHFLSAGNKRAAAGSGFNVPAKVPGAALINVGFAFGGAPVTVYRNKSLTGWSLGAGAARAAQDVYSPEHRLSAAVIRELATDPNHNIFLSSAITGLASTTKEYSVSIARGVGSRDAVVEIGKNGGNYFAMKYAINLTTGAITASGNDGTAQVTQSAVATLDADGFWRVVIRITYDSTMPASPFLFVRMTDSPTQINPNYTGDGVSTLKIWGFDVK